MKKILVLTDFTPNAAHAAEAALRLSAALGLRILLYHTLQSVPLIPGDSDDPYVAETAGVLFENSREHLQQEAERLEKLAGNSSYAVPDIENTNGDGSISDVIEKLSADPEIEMIIMGGRSGGAMEHLLTGSDTAAVIRKAVKPVLIIPAAVNWDIPKKFVFASDFGEADIAAVKFLLGLSNLPGFQLDVMHVIKQGEVVTDVSSEVAFRKYLAQNQVNYIQVFGDVQQALQQYCRENNSDVLAITHGHHSFISRIFGHSESEAVIAGKQLAVLIFPPGFKP